MNEDIRNQHGAFSWGELMTKDPAASKRFYSELLGWETKDTEMPPSAGGGQPMTYTSLMIGKEESVGGLMKMPPEVPEGVPPYWGLYVTVKDIDAVAAKVEALGGSLVCPVMDLKEVGRMAVIHDPQGAVLSLIQYVPAEMFQPGEDVRNKHGAFSWGELLTTDADAAKQFYGELLGWEMEDRAMPYCDGEGDGFTYTLAKLAADQPVGGIMKIPPQMPEGIPPHWGVYVTVNDVDAVAAKARELGATLTYEPMDAEGVGRMTNLRDPQGAHLSVIQYNEQF